jgi:magnesium transporter
MRAFVVADGSVRETTSLADVRAAVGEGRTLWVDLQRRSPDADAVVADVFALHPLTIEDIWSDHPGPKVEAIDPYLYVIVHALERADGGSDVTLREVDVVIGPRFLITYDGTGACTGPLAADLLRSPRLLSRGTAWLAHALLDRLVDAYSPVVDRFGDEVGAIEDEVLAKAGTQEGTAVLARILGFKRALHAMHRVAVHQREVLLHLGRGEYELLPPEVLPYFRDVHDHFVRVVDLADSYRDLLTSVLEVFLSVQSNRMNQIMKTLTVISTVMLPITFIAGVYGMNFDAMPELRWRWGYPFALGLMATVVTGVLAIFRHKRWLD